MESDSVFSKEIAIQKRIQKAFETAGEDPRVSQDIAFHMTDWLSDVKDLLDVFSTIESLSDKQIRGFVYKFLAHVPNHLNAAMKLSGIGKVEDVFEVGILEDDDD
jgi:hypothetical protein